MYIMSSSSNSLKTVFIWGLILKPDILDQTQKSRISRSEIWCLRIWFFRCRQILRLRKLASLGDNLPFMNGEFHQISEKTKRWQQARKRGKVEVQLPTPLLGRLSLSVVSASKEPYNVTSMSWLCLCFIFVILFKILWVLRGSLWIVKCGGHLATLREQNSGYRSLKTWTGYLQSRYSSRGC